MTIEWQGSLEDKTVAELRKLLEPFGTPYRLQLRKAKLIAAIRRIRMEQVDLDNSVSRGSY